MHILMLFFIIFFYFNLIRVSGLVWSGRSLLLFLSGVTAVAGMRELSNNALVIWDPYLRLSFSQKGRCNCNFKVMVKFVKKKIKR